MLFRGGQQGPEDKKVIRAVRLDEIVVRRQHKAGPFDLADHHIVIDSVIITVAVAIDDSQAGSRTHGSTDVPQQYDGLRHFMVGFHEEHCVEAVGRQQRVIALAQMMRILGVLLSGAIADVIGDRTG